MLANTIPDSESGYGARGSRTPASITSILSLYKGTYSIQSDRLLQRKWHVEGVAMGAHTANDIIDKERTEGAIAAVGCAGKWFYGLPYHPE
ncbi:hypothetical protein Tco_1445897, partial [Tanacetum coccineum]